MALVFFPLVTRLLKQWPLKETDLEEPTSCKSKEVPSTAEHVLLLQSKEFDNSPSVGNKKILQITILMLLNKLLVVFLVSFRLQIHRLKTKVQEALEVVEEQLELVIITKTRDSTPILQASLKFV